MKINSHNNNSFSTRFKEGSIRLQNEHVIELVKYINTGTFVIITPSAEDIVAIAEIN